MTASYGFHRPSMKSHTSTQNNHAPASTSTVDARSSAHFIVCIHTSL